RLVARFGLGGGGSSGAAATRVGDTERALRREAAPDHDLRLERRRARRTRQQSAARMTRQTLLITNPVRAPGVAKVSRTSDEPAGTGTAMKTSQAGISATRPPSR